MEKKTYITPETGIVAIIAEDNIAQFIISSHSIEEGEAKRGNFSNYDFEEDEVSWDDPLP